MLGLGQRYALWVLLFYMFLLGSLCSVFSLGQTVFVLCVFHLYIVKMSEQNKLSKYKSILKN